MSQFQITKKLFEVCISIKVYRKTVTELSCLSQLPVQRVCIFQSIYTDHFLRAEFAKVCYTALILCVSILFFSLAERASQSLGPLRYAFNSPVKSPGSRKYKGDSYSSAGSIDESVWILKDFLGMWVMVAAQNALVQIKINSEDFLKTPASVNNLLYW